MKRLLGDFVYLIYAVMYLYIDHCPDVYPETWDWQRGVNTSLAHGSVNATMIWTDEGADWHCYDPNHLYVVGGILHFIGAIIWVAASADVHADIFTLASSGHSSPSASLPPLAVFLLPDVLNLMDAVIYFSTATNYGPLGSADYESQGWIILHRCELLASVLEILAALLYIRRWWYFEREADELQVPAVMNLNFYSASSLLVGAAIYTTYNAHMVLDPASYATDSLYEWGNGAYFVNAVFYFVISAHEATSSVRRLSEAKSSEAKGLLE